jgi:predicted membrane protein
MAHLSHGPTPPAAETFNPKDAGGWPALCLGVGVICTAASMIGLLIPAWREQFAYSWLFAFAYFFTICVGALFWTLVHHATDAEWSVLVRRQLENIASQLKWVFILIIPLLLVCPHGQDGHSIVWAWWNKAPGEDPILDAKSGYLNHTFFYVRVVVYFVGLCGLAWLLRSQSVAQDRDGLGKHSSLMRRASVFGLVVFGVCMTFAAVDWLMGLDYHWFSTMWGVYIFAGAAGSSMSLLVLIVSALRGLGYLKPLNMEHYHIMGKWMLAFTIFWAYIGFDQYMLIWYANMPEETHYFVLRNTESWWVFSTLLVVGRFWIPFPILLTQWIKKHPNRLCLLAAWVLLMQLLDMYVVVIPSLHQHGFRLISLPSDLLALAGVGGIVAFFWFQVLKKDHMFPTRDPRLLGSLKLTN